MKTLEIRRHSFRTQPNEHLSQKGVTLARKVGKKMGPFQRVITSTLPRAFETAIAMGFAVDEQNKLLNTYSEAVDAEVPWPQTFAVYASAVRTGGAAAKYARRLNRFYVELMESLPKDGAALVVNHGGVVELSAVACLPDADYESFGPQCEQCEGVRLYWKKGKFIKIKLLRV